MKIAALLCFCFILVSSPSSSLEMKYVEDVYEFLWQNNIDIANMTIKVDFLREMENGSLQAERYVNFTIQDINYIVKVTQMLKEMSKKVTQPTDLSNFMNKMFNSYQAFANYFIDLYCFLDSPLIKESPAMMKYLSFYRKLMEKDPLYFAVGLLPCSRLWPWLAKNLNIPPNNPYYTWKQQNMEGHPEEDFKALLNKYINTTEQVNIANDVFRTQMQNEHDFFFTS